MYAVIKTQSAMTDRQRAKQEPAESEWAAFLEESARTNALKWVDELIDAHERGAQELRRYRARLVEAFDEDGSEGATQRSLSAPKDVISWIVNACMNVHRNLRLDLATDRAVDLAMAAAARRKAGGASHSNVS